MSDPSALSRSSAALDALRGIGGDLLVEGDAIPERYWRDWSGLDPVRPLALARPRTTQEVAAVLRLCCAHRLPVVPQGGLTGLAGGALPVAEGIALSLDRMQGIEELDPAMATMTVLAGTPLVAIQAAAEEAGLFFALDLGARGSCTIGGNLSTNAGGNRVIRYGMAREQVLGIEAVVADGTIVGSLNKLVKNNAGYDLKQLFIGSEGTLGIITRAVLRLQPRPTFTASAFCAAESFDRLVELLRAVRARLGPGLSAFEVMWPSFYEFMAARLPGVKPPFRERHGGYALIEMSGFDGPSDGERFEACLAGLLERGIIADAVIGKADREIRDLWAIREGVSEYGSLLGPVTAFDIGLALDRSGAFVAAAEPAIRERWPGAVVLSYGHIGDSNLHLVVNVPSAGAHQPHDAIAGFVYAAVHEAGGTISAEHGIGLAKKPYLPFTRSAAELDAMARLKRTFDPHGILNPGKVLPDAP